VTRRLWCCYCGHPVEVPHLCGSPPVVREVTQPVFAENFARVTKGNPEYIVISGRRTMTLRGAE
jgi:hypothetical protein